MKVAATLCFALGVASVVAGALAFHFGINAADTITVTGLGPLNGTWEPPAHCFAGAAAVAVGSGLTVFGAVWTALLFRHGSAVAPRRRWLVWALALPLGVAALGTGATLRFAKAGPGTAPADREAAKLQVTVALLQLAHGQGVEPQTTGEFQRRLRAQKQSVRYNLTRLSVRATGPDAAGHITAAGTITATAKRTSLDVAAGPLVGAGFALVTFDPPKEVGFAARLVRGDGNAWLIDELTFEEP